MIIVAAQSLVVVQQALADGQRGTVDEYRATGKGTAEAMSVVETQAGVQDITVITADRLILAEGATRDAASGMIVDGAARAVARERPLTTIARVGQVDGKGTALDADLAEIVVPAANRQAGEVGIKTDRQTACAARATSHVAGKRPVGDAQRPKIGNATAGRPTHEVVDRRRAGNADAGIAEGSIAGKRDFGEC